MLLCLHASLLGVTNVSFDADVTHIKHHSSMAVHQQSMTVYAFTQMVHTQMIPAHEWFLHDGLGSVTIIVFIVIITIIIVSIIVNITIIIFVVVVVMNIIITITIFIPAGETCEKLGLKISLCWLIRRTRMTTA